MKIVLKVILASLFLLLLQNQSLAQLHYTHDLDSDALPYHLAMGVLQEGLNGDLVIDKNSLKWGIEPEQLNFQIKNAIENAGWRYNPFANNSINITIDSVSSNKKEYKSIKITVQNFYEEFPTIRTLEFQTTDNNLISSTLYQVVHNTALKSRRYALDQFFKKPDPDKSLQRGRFMINLIPIRPPNPGG